jgi:hypothetical protein
MLNRRVTFWAAITLIAVLALSGCAPRAGQGSMDADSDQLVVDLPALVLDIGADGSTSIMNATVADLVAKLGVSLDLPIDAGTVFFISMANIQHIQVSNTPGGLLLLVNGRSIPSISYDGDSLSALPGAIETFDIAPIGPMADLLVELVDQIGVGVIARFPVAPGMEEIPMYVEGDSSAAMAAQAAQDEFLDSVGTPPRINLPVFYHADGSISIGDLSVDELSAMTGGALGDLSMALGALTLVRDMGISQLGISTNADGITLTIDGNTLPTLDWSDGKASNLIEVVSQIPILSMMGMGSILPMVHQVLPLVQASEIDLTLNF